MMTLDVLGQSKHLEQTHSLASSSKVPGSSHLGSGFAPSGAGHCSQLELQAQDWGAEISQGLGTE